MRKQTKVVAVASAAALLAIGGAMTSSFSGEELGWKMVPGTTTTKMATKLRTSGKNLETTGSGLMAKRAVLWQPTRSSLTIRTHLLCRW